MSLPRSHNIQRYLTQINYLITQNTGNDKMQCTLHYIEWNSGYVINVRKQWVYISAIMKIDIVRELCSN